MKRMRFPPSHIVLHTAAFRGPADAKIILGWHLDRDFEDIGYHFIVTGSFYDSKAQIEQGRPLDFRGAHAFGLNNSVGICVTGHGDHMEWTEKQMEMVGVLCKSFMRMYNIPLKNVIGHRETWLQKLNPKKTCPGKLIDMKEVRKFIQGSKGHELYKYMARQYEYEHSNSSKET